MSGERSLDESLLHAIDIALKAGRLLRRRLAFKRRVRYKGRIDLVTEADKASEDLIFGALRRGFPDDDVLSEEGSNRATNSARRWVVDPLDGTTNYAHGISFFCVSIALQVAGRVELGIVFAPIHDELFVARRGHGAFLVVDDGLRALGEKRPLPLPAPLFDRPHAPSRTCGPSVCRFQFVASQRPHGARLVPHGGPPGIMRLRVSAVSSLHRAILVTGFPYDVHLHPGNYFRWFRRFCMAAQAVRRLGSAAIDMCYVAAGRLDGFWESKLHAWDTAAAQLIVEEAGGRVTDFSGRPFDMFGTETLASNGRVHRRMVETLR
ncbi:MAG: inositol monophosphatase family protein [Planctomycetota bacterium]|nr:inositol monophosphatase family protein [Planctomycetota bacterium]